MKTKLFLVLLLVSVITSAQNWEQVGATQFTNFASDGAMAFHPTTGEPYVIYSNVLDSNKPYVMKFDGASWVAVGGPASSLASVNLAIEFNPISNEPWIAYRRVSDNKLDVYRYDGTNWIAEGTAEGNGNLDNDRVQIQFNATGNVRVAAKVDNLPLRIFTYNSGSWVITEETLLNQSQFMLDQHYDFTSYDNYFVAAAFTDNSSRVGKRVVGSTGYNVIYSHTLNGRTMRNIAGVDDSNFLASKNELVKQMVVLNQSGFLSPIGESLIDQTGNTNGIVGLRKSIANNKFYLMYTDGSDNLLFKEYESNATNAVTTMLPPIGLTAAGSGFYEKMVMNPVDGNLYVLYLDGPRLSLKKYSIPLPSNLPKIYVDVNATGSNDGTSWADAHNDLQDALFNVGNATTELWVASGTYTPGTNRGDSFIFGQDNLQIYGGFDGTETSVSQRDIASNPTILSGDLNGDDTGVGFSGNGRSENSYHILNITGSDIILDGFKIENGHANSSGSNAYGGAITIGGQAESLNIKNCEFNNNMGLTGGAIRSSLSVNTSMTFLNCKFNNNLSRYGSGIYFLVNTNRTVTLDLVNCLFTNNTSSNNGSQLGFTGSAIWARANASGSNLTTTVTNCTFANNTDIGTQSGSERGPLALARRTDGNSTHNVTLSNSIFYNNEGASNVTTLAVNKGHVSMPNLTIVNNAIDEDNFSNLTFLTNTSNANPMFTDASNNDFTLMVGSPAIDTGDNSKIPTGIITDLLGNQRIFNTTVDMGAYEFGSMALGTQVFLTNDFQIKLYPNPATSSLSISAVNFEINQIEVYNVTGQLVLKSEEKTIHISNLKSGIYLLKAKTISGDIVRRFIKK